MVFQRRGNSEKDFTKERKNEFYTHTHTHTRARAHTHTHTHTHNLTLHKCFSMNTE